MPGGFVVDVGSLFSTLIQLHDKRDARGLRYTLVTGVLRPMCAMITLR